jgi:IS1 family transposase
MMISFMIDTNESSLSEPLITETQRRLAQGSWPIWVSDGLDSYGEALKNRHCILKTYPRTGKRGRPRRPKLVACPELRYGQVVKKRDERHRVIEVFKRSVYGDIPLTTISTVYIERHNLNLRHENRRLTRKTVAFSKKDEGLKAQMTVYQSYFNFVRSHHGLKVAISDHHNRLRKWQYRTPAIAAGLTDHIWSFRELMTRKIFINC